MADRKTLIVVGPNRGDKHIDELLAKHDSAMFFEPLPDAVSWLRNKYSFNRKVTIIEAACSDVASMSCKLRLYNTNGVSSSLGVCTSQAREKYADADLLERGEIEVRVVNLHNELKSVCIDQIETLMIDAQGMDLTILRTMEPYIKTRRIKRIECEADGDGFTHYSDVPSNSEADFMDFMRAFPWYKPGRLPDRNNWNPDLTWTLEES